MAQLQIVIVTPETTTLDKMVDSITLPMFDGEAGVLAGHAAMIGRLGPGELRVKSGTATERFYVDGGFVQVENDVVSVLTGKSLAVAEIDVAVAKDALAKAEQEPSDNPELADIKQKAIDQARAQIRMAEKV
jgi:F-type H+-transporting ATPase subunit epsilon